MSTASLLYRRPAPFDARLALQIQDRMNETNAVIPGGSPFFYMEDPSGHLFTIISITMSPSPCQMYSNPFAQIRWHYRTPVLMICSVVASLARSKHAVPFAKVFHPSISTLISRYASKTGNRPKCWRSGMTCANGQQWNNRVVYTAVLHEGGQQYSRQVWPLSEDGLWRYDSGICAVL